jgi:hypothetical protein
LGNPSAKTNSSLFRKFGFVVELEIQNRFLAVAFFQVCVSGFGFQPASFQVLGFFFRLYFLCWQKFRLIFVGFQNRLVSSWPAFLFKFSFDLQSQFLLAVFIVGFAGSQNWRVFF